MCEDEVILEQVDGRTLATGLSNRTFPFVRYDLGDAITLLTEPCPCGSAFARVADIDGRRDDDFAYGPHTVPASAFRHVLGTDPRIVEYQVRQTERGADILVVASGDVRDLADAVVAAMRRFGIVAPVVRIDGVASLGRHEATGKLVRFVALSAP